ncbi:MAG TPA: NAD-dependent deacylase [bacterium]|nr:NAD-dependent deacylase [bacterium]
MDRLIERLKHAENVTFLTGSGISKESGIPTFRGEDGLWKNYSPEELASPEGFMRDPQLVWDWYNWRRDIIRKAEPNRGHLIIKEFERFFNIYVITQNVDGLHEKTGVKNLVELHGNIFRNRCSRCGKMFGDIQSKKIPTCECGGLIRPDVVWFGEPLKEKDLSMAIEWSKKADVFFLVGTSGIVYPAASLPFFAKENRGFVVEINIEKTPLTPHIDLHLEGSASQVLDMLLKDLNK